MARFYATISVERRLSLYIRKIWSERWGSTGADKRSMLHCFADCWAVMSSFYQHSLAERCRILADHEFVRDENHIWRHRDGRAIGEGVMSALIDTAFLGYLSIDGSVA